MDLLAAALLGIVQGLTEFLPISSTAHLLIAERLVHFEDSVFTVTIQFGSVLAVMWLYREKLARGASRSAVGSGIAAVRGDADAGIRAGRDCRPVP